MRPQLHQVLLGELRAAGKLDLDTAVVDGSHGRAPKGGLTRGPSPVDRDRNGCKHQLLTDAHGAALVVTLTGGHRPDVPPQAGGAPTQLLLLVDAFPIMRGVRGQPRLHPGYLYADCGYDFDVYRRALRDRGITPRIARRGVAHGSGLGRTRRVVERTFAWLHQFKRLRIRYEVRADLHLGLLQLACALICYRKLPAS